MRSVSNRVSHSAHCSVVIVSDGNGQPHVTDDGTDDGSLLGRVTQIGRVFARHVVGDDADEADRARRVREALEELGPTFAKLGQLLSTRLDLISPEMAAELARLQDDVTPLPQSQVAEVLERELGVPLEDVFTSFDPAPLAAGTIAQVHRATLPTGERVVVKVQRPNAGRQIRQDLRLLEMFASKAASRRAFGRVLDLEAVHEHLAESLQRELDFTIEAASIVRFREGLTSYPRLGAPKPYRELSTRRVLVMDEVRGIPAREAPAGPARSEAARQLLASYYQQVLGDGFFHADPHPGNLRWADDGLWFLDFGMMGEVSRRERDLLLVLLMALWRGDASFLAESIVMLAGAERRPDIDLPVLEADLEGLLERLSSGTVGDIELGPILSNVATVAAAHGLRLPASLVLAGKALAQMQQTASALDPELQPLAVVGAFLRRRAIDAAIRHADPELLLYEAEKLRLRAGRLVEGLERAVGARPGAGIQVELRDAREIEAAIRRLGLVIAAAVVAAAVIVALAFVLSQ
jgi:predicted unusual protein kinase regulating ubiquinone biosynthesis (AarF/ABC1/UbiB family)